MKVVACLIMMFCLFTTKAKKDLPLHYTDSRDTSKPLIVYLSGDGGMNSFSNSLIRSLNKKGYAVLALDTRDYFWQKKEPQEFATAMSQAINSYFSDKKRNSFILLGYSFGADVSPFLVTRLPPYLFAKCKQVVLLSPSVHTDFEIKILDMLDWGSKKDKNVISELNKLTTPVLLFFGKDEDDFPINEVTIKKQVVVMEGGHHYDNNVDDLATQIIGRTK